MMQKGLIAYMQTNGRGWGLQTLTDIKAGQLITEYRGEIISQRLCEERLRTVYKDTNNFYFLDYQNGEVIDAAAKGSDARFVNHSCDPNCHIEKW
jgi:SET domain-containing protein